MAAACLASAVRLPSRWLSGWISAGSWTLVAVKHIAHYIPGRGHIARGFVEALLDGICPRTCDGGAGGRPSCLESCLSVADCYQRQRRSLRRQRRLASRASADNDRQSLRPMCLVRDLSGTCLLMICCTSLLNSWTQSSTDVVLSKLYSGDCRMLFWKAAMPMSILIVLLQNIRLEQYIEMCQISFYRFYAIYHLSTFHKIPNRNFISGLILCLSVESFLHISNSRFLKLNLITKCI